MVDWIGMLSFAAVFKDYRIIMQWWYKLSETAQLMHLDSLIKQFFH